MMNDRKFHVLEAAADHEARGDLCERDAGGFADIRNCARGAWINFENVDRVALDGILHVHQANDFESNGETLGVIANDFQYFGREADGRKDAGGIAGVHAGFFDVFHDAADDNVGTVG